MKHVVSFIAFGLVIMFFSTASLAVDTSDVENSTMRVNPSEELKLPQQANEQAVTHAQETEDRGLMRAFQAIMEGMMRSLQGKENAEQHRADADANKTAAKERAEAAKDNAAERSESARSRAEAVAEAARNLVTEKPPKGSDVADAAKDVSDPVKNNAHETAQAQ